jgi:hypothetical protein
MVSGSWFNQDGLMLQYGTQKAIPEQGGDYLMYGPNRVMEVVVDLTSLTTTAQVQSLTTFFPSGLNYVIEEVVAYTDVAAVGGTSFSLGLGYFSGSTYGNITTNVETQGGSSPTVVASTGSYPGITSISDTAFINAMTQSTVGTLGNKSTQNVGSTYAGGYIGQTSTTTTQPNYITAKAAGTFTAGLIRCRIYYRGIGTIQQ